MMRLTAVMTALALAACARPMTLVQDGQPRASICLPAEAHPDLVRASEELRDYLRKSTGAELPVVEGEADGPVILLGAQWAPDLAALDLGEDGYVIEVAGERLLIAGNTPRATLYGACDFLERFVGVRWYWPGEVGECVPARRTVTVPEGRIVERPDFGLRMPWSGTARWLYRNRCNPEDNILAGHAYDRLVPREKYAGQHPEYYGTCRGRPSGQLCLSNPDVLNIVVQALRERFDANSHLRSASISPNDNPWFCECDNCRALDTGGTMMVGRNEVPIVTDRVLWFSNRVAEELAKTHPDKLLGLYIYHNYTPLPRRERPHPNLVLWVCHHTPACYAHTIDDPTCPANVDFHRFLSGWTQYGNRVVVYAYVWKTVQDHVLWPMQRIIAHDIRCMRDLGVWGYYGQGRQDNAALLGLNYWLCAKLTWDADLDVDALLEDYYRNFYGEAYEPMKACHERLMRAVAGIGDHHVNYDPRAEAPVYLTREVLADTDRLLSEAEGMARDAKVRQRLRMVRAVWTHSKLYLQAAAAMNAWREGGAEADLLAAVTAYRALQANLNANQDCFVLDREGNLKGGWLPRYQREAEDLYMADIGARKLEVADLPERWRFRLDPDDVGVEQGWGAEEFDDTGWEELAVGRSWEAQGHDYDGHAWYRCRFEVPAGAEGRAALLFFGGVDGHAWVYLNGEMIGEHHDWATGFELNAAGHLRYGGENTLAVRVYDGAGLGGICGPVILYAPPDNIWLHGGRAAATHVTVEGGDAARWQLRPTGAGAVLITEHIGTADNPNPYDGSWVE
ncbi:MAG: DUF4838 domain-containing protein [Armatimonadetes bacterium]|nr:DUF4838 domain-containing protein [Armatimonadota bacterium]